jgi:hypothetical protein
VSDEFADWYRVGGKTLQFYATDDEIAELLLEALPDDFGPYAVLGAEWRENQWVPHEYPLEEITIPFTRHRSANHWIRSDVLSPGLTAQDETHVAWSGLIEVQLGFVRPDGRLEEASIAIVDRIRHEHTGQERRFTEYLKIFERLRRSMRKRLVVETERVNPDGNIYGDWPMTPRAADAHVRGEVRFYADPVGLRE